MCVSENVCVRARARARVCERERARARVCVARAHVLTRTRTHTHTHGSGLRQLYDRAGERTHRRLLVHVLVGRRGSPGLLELRPPPQPPPNVRVRNARKAKAARLHWDYTE
jgi:hypothetical protein